MSRAAVQQYRPAFASGAEKNPRVVSSQAVRHSCLAVCSSVLSISYLDLFWVEGCTGVVGIMRRRTVCLHSRKHKLLEPSVERQGHSSLRFFFFSCLSSVFPGSPVIVSPLSLCLGAAGYLEVQRRGVDGLRERPQRPFCQGLARGLRPPGNESQWIEPCVFLLTTVFFIVMETNSRLSNLCCVCVCVSNDFFGC